MLERPDSLMVSDRKLGITTTILFSISTITWIIASVAGIAMVLTGAIQTMSIIFVVLRTIIFVTRYAALIVGVVAILRTNSWDGGTGWLVAAWFITCWFGLLFVRDLIVLFLLAFGASMLGPGTMGEAVGYSSIPSRPPL